MYNCSHKMREKGFSVCFSKLILFLFYKYSVCVCVYVLFNQLFLHRARRNPKGMRNFFLPFHKIIKSTCVCTQNPMCKEKEQNCLQHHSKVWIQDLNEYRKYRIKPSYVHPKPLFHGNCQPTVQMYNVCHTNKHFWDGWTWTCNCLSCLSFLSIDTFVSSSCTVCVY